MMIVQSGRFSGGATCVVDPYAANLSFFLRGQGVDGATPATDDTGKSLSRTSAQIRTTQSKWPAYGSAEKIVGGGAITSPANAAFALPGDFWIEGWYYFDTLPTSTVLLLNVTLGVQFILNATSLLVQQSGGGAGTVSVARAGLVTAGAFNHLCAGRSGGTAYLFAGGSLVASGADANNYNTSGTLGVYAGGDIGTSGGTDVYTVDVQLFKGICKHTSSFTPPTLPPC